MAHVGGRMSKRATRQGRNRGYLRNPNFGFQDDPVVGSGKGTVGGLFDGLKDLAGGLFDGEVGVEGADVQAFSGHGHGVDGGD